MSVETLARSSYVTEAEHMGDDTGVFSFANTATTHHHGRTEFFYLAFIAQVTK